MTDYMNEAERLISAHEWAIRQHDRGAEWDDAPEKTLAALLAHIQRGASAVVPGVMHCARCKFRLQRVNLYVNNGTVGAGDNAPESCPNGCGPLWPVTWEQEAREGYKLTEDLFERAKRAEDTLDDMRKQAPAPAGVPMPKPVAYGFGNTAITGHTNRLMMVRIDIPGGDQYAGAFWLPLVLADEAHTYGVACRAAGEAAGYARGREEAGKDAERYRWLCDKATEQQWVKLGGYTVTNDIDDYIDAALREEVK